MEAMESLSRTNLDSLRQKSSIDAGTAKAEARQKLKDKIQQKKDGPAPPPPQQQQAGPAPPPAAAKWSARDTIALNKSANRVAEQREQGKSEPRRQAKFRLASNYVERFPQHFAAYKKQLKADIGEADLDLLIKHFKSIMGKQNRPPVADGLLAMLMNALEYVTHEKKINPAKLSVHKIGLATTMALKDPVKRKELFEPEIIEAEIELFGDLSAPWWARLAYKLGGFVYSFSEQQKQLQLRAYANRQMPPGGAGPAPPPPPERADSPLPAENSVPQ